MTATKSEKSWSATNPTSKEFSKSAVLIYSDTLLNNDLGLINAKQNSFINI